MYASSADEDAGLLVGVYRGKVMREEDYARAVASIQRLYERALQQASAGDLSARSARAS